jgi:hypothetical protein
MEALITLLTLLVILLIGFNFYLYRQKGKRLAAIYSHYRKLQELKDL